MGSKKPEFIEAASSIVMTGGLSGEGTGEILAKD